MSKLTEDIVSFFHKQPYTIVTTVDKKGCPHNSCKGIVDIEEDGTIYLLDLYKEKTYSNLKENPHVNITAVDEHKFIGFCLKGKAEIANKEVIHSAIVKKWEDRITKRISQRLLRNIQGQKGHPSHPESLFPKPEYLIKVIVEEIIDLTPHHIKKNSIK